MNEQIRGLTTGTTVNQFLSGITKANDMQKLKVVRENGEISGDEIITSTRTRFQWLRTPYAWNKPRQSKPEVIIQIPERFKGIV